MKKIVIRRKGKDEDLYYYLNGIEFQIAVGTYYEEKVHKNPTCNLQLPYIGYDLESFSIKNIMNCEKRHRNGNELKETAIIQKLKDKITIFQTLYAYNAKNESLIKRFMSELYDEVLYFYFVIYYKKKFIYMRYLEIFKNVLRQKNIPFESWISSKNQPNRANTPNQPNQKNRINQSNETVKVSIQNEENKSSSNPKIKEIENKIQKLQQKRQELEKNKNQPNFDKKILLIEKYIHELILEKRKFY
jgi:hypothetical protein